ncbi:GNAT family N-acetyltransferase [Acidiphilium acidophilum]|uniref:GNAT family N-acetyltransferase n=1 Tax=Acidiphilium acidophilum TaxID=76588 RepID=A0AAW9DQB7_ACIAO|nr:GNAT family N-acetyltransferase [Acidiphilium acidophilum]MDX5931198.1 GNAT family N-acetyltransferase [Acidiphilium acidophilum]
MSDFNNIEQNQQSLFEISPIRDQNIDLWFQVGPKPINHRAAIDRVTADISSDSPHKTFRLVVHKGHETYARIAAKVDTGKRLEIWPPFFNPKLSAICKEDISNLILEYFKRILSENTVKYNQARFLKLHPDAKQWQDALLRDGFYFVAEAAILNYVKSGIYNCAAHPYAISRGNIFTEACLLDLYIACQADTMDRADRDPNVELQADFFDFLDPAEASADRSTWLVATTNIGPVGLLIPQIDHPARSGWIAYIGVIKPCRGQRVGTALIGHFLSGHDAVEVIRVMVDVHNHNSIQLYQPEVPLTRM